MAAEPTPPTLDLATVRAYVRVPTTALSDEDLGRMLAGCSADQWARCIWPTTPAEPLTLAIDGMTATVTATGGTPGALYYAVWGDTFSDEVTLDPDGNGTASHTYLDPGTYTSIVLNEWAQTVVIYSAMTVPDDRPVAADTYPDALAQALLRRIQKEIAARNLPLGMVGLDAAEYGPQSLPFLDSLVEEHERAYRRVVLA